MEEVKVLVASKGPRATGSGLQEEEEGMVDVWWSSFTIKRLLQVLFFSLSIAEFPQFLSLLSRVLSVSFSLSLSESLSPSPIQIIYVQSRCCHFASGRADPAHLWNYCCCEFKLFLDARKLLLPPRKLLHLLLLHHVSLLQGNPSCSCTTGSSQRVKSRISGSIIILLTIRRN